jgi:hypothetical protein
MGLADEMKLIHFRNTYRSTVVPDFVTGTGNRLCHPGVFHPVLGKKD